MCTKEPSKQQTHANELINWEPKVLFFYETKGEREREREKGREKEKKRRKEKKGGERDHLTICRTLLGSPYTTAQCNAVSPFTSGFDGSAPCERSADTSS